MIDPVQLQFRRAQTSDVGDLAAVAGALERLRLEAAVFRRVGAAFIKGLAGPRLAGVLFASRAGARRDEPRAVGAHVGRAARAHTGAPDRARRVAM